MEVIREYNSNDLDRVNYILNEAFSIEKNNSEIDNNIYTELVFELDNIVVGYLLITRIIDPIRNVLNFHIDYVCVDSKYRGYGIGTKMFEKIDEIAREENVHYIELTSGYKREAAHRLYEKCGYIKRESYIFRKVINE